MITRAIISEIKKDGTPTVYIPLIDGEGNKKELFKEASVIYLPGIDIRLQVGDIVVVGFEDYDIGRPIIFGYLKLNGKDLDSRVYSIDITDNLHAPTNTTIGKTNYPLLFNAVNNGQTLSAEDKAKLDRIKVDADGNFTFPSLAGIKVANDGPEYPTPTYVCVFNKNNAPDGLAWCRIEDLAKQLKQVEAQPSAEVVDSGEEKSE